MPVMRSFDIFVDLRLSKRLSKPSRRQWFEKPSRSLWHHNKDKSAKCCTWHWKGHYLNLRWTTIGRHEYIIKVSSKAIDHTAPQLHRCRTIIFTAQLLWGNEQFRKTQWNPQICAFGFAKNITMLPHERLSVSDIRTVECLFNSLFG